MEGGVLQNPSYKGRKQNDYNQTVRKNTFKSQLLTEKPILDVIDHILQQIIYK